MIKITFIITDLHTGGAQVMLLKLLSGLDRTNFEPVVISLLNAPELLPSFKSIDVPVSFLGMGKKVPDPRWFFRLRKMIKNGRPHLVQTWMYHADLLGGLAARSAGLPVIWNIRHSQLERDVNKRATILIARACALISCRVPEMVICCANSARDVHAALGYDRKRMIVIPNGFELSRFSPDSAARLSVRRELSIPDDGLVIGLFGRFHPQKDHETFMRAASILEPNDDRVFFVLCGDDITWGNQELASMIRETGKADFFRLLGRREDMPRLNAALDIACSSSSSEGFSNTLGEAMSCEVVCAVTDVGDSADILGPAGMVVPPRDGAAMASAWQSLINLGEDRRRELGRLGRRRISENFSLETIVQRYQNLYLQTLVTNRYPLPVS